MQLFKSLLVLATTFIGSAFGANNFHGLSAVSGRILVGPKRMYVVQGSGIVHTETSPRNGRIGIYKFTTVNERPRIHIVQRIK